MPQHTFTISFPDIPVSINVAPHTTVLEAEIAAGLHPDAPCGGRGTCGKCKVRVLSGRESLRMQGKPLPPETWLPACQLTVEGDAAIALPSARESRILTTGAGPANEAAPAEGAFFAVAAFDVGTTSVVGYLLDGRTGRQLAVDSRLNPQTQFGADVVARGSYAMEHGVDALRDVIRQALEEMLGNLAAKASLDRREIRRVSIVGNTCMHHLFLSYSPGPLMVAPYMPEHRAAEVRPAAQLGLTIAPDGEVWILPCIAGFVGADTVGCLLASDWSRREPLTLMIDIGTNGEMVLGNRHRSITCSTAAGPAFEGAKIRCGMRGADGAIDHVFLQEDGSIGFSVVGGGKAEGLCGSGLLDAVAVLLDQGILTYSGRMKSAGFPQAGLVDNQPAYFFTGNVFLTQADIREVQLAKGAIAAGIQLLCTHLGVSIDDIDQVLIAGAFGNYMSPDSACRIGLLPQALRPKIQMIGNAAGEGAKLAVLHPEQYALATTLSNEVTFLELANDPSFQDIFVDSLFFEGEAEED